LTILNVSHELILSCDEKWGRGLGYKKFGHESYGTYACLSMVSAKRAEIYMKAIIQSTKASLLKSWPWRGSNGATIWETVVTSADIGKILLKSFSQEQQDQKS
jgi:hypothetical protein